MGGGERPQRYNIKWYVGTPLIIFIIVAAENRTFAQSRLFGVGGPRRVVRGPLSPPQRNSKRAGPRENHNVKYVSRVRTFTCSIKRKALILVRLYGLGYNVYEPCV